MTLRGLPQISFAETHTAYGPGFADLRILQLDWNIRVFDELHSCIRNEDQTSRISVLDPDPIFLGNSDRIRIRKKKIRIRSPLPFTDMSGN